MLLVISTIGLLIGSIVSGCNATELRKEHNDLKADAIRRGYAEWRPSAKGEPEFTWKEPPTPAKY